MNRLARDRTSVEHRFPFDERANVSMSVSDNVNRSCLILVSKLGGRFKRAKRSNDPIDDLVALDAISILPFTCRHNLTQSYPRIKTRVSDLFNEEFGIFLIIKILYQRNRIESL